MNPDLPSPEACALIIMQSASSDGVQVVCEHQAQGGLSRKQAAECSSARWGQERLQNGDDVGAES